MKSTNKSLLIEFDGGVFTRIICLSRSLPFNISLYITLNCISLKRIQILTHSLILILSLIGHVCLFVISV